LQCLLKIPENAMTTNFAAADNALIRIDDFHYPQGWSPPAAAARARQCCEQLEAGKVLCLERIPYLFPQADCDFLLLQRQSGSRLHKNVSYRPRQDLMRGAAGDREEQASLHDIMRRYSAEVTRFMGQLLQPYAAHWTLDYASYRPQEEEGRDLPVHKRNDLLHVDAFPTRPMHGRRILRCFTNINPAAPRVWYTADEFSVLAREYAARAGLAGFASGGGARGNGLLRGVKKMFGLKGADPSAYDRFMLRFHDYLKENAAFQRDCRKVRLEFPPGATWICFTDAVPHSVQSGRYALEQTFIIALPGLVTPDKAPIRVLENLAGKPLASAP
jgi:hypothetical protein